MFFYAHGLEHGMVGVCFFMRMDLNTGWYAHIFFMRMDLSIEVLFFCTTFPCIISPFSIESRYGVTHLCSSAYTS